jgi:hypothetical protein
MLGTWWGAMVANVLEHCCLTSTCQGLQWLATVFKRIFFKQIGIPKHSFEANKNEIRYLHNRPGVHGVENMEGEKRTKFLLVPSLAEEMSSCNYLSWQRITLLDCCVWVGGWVGGGGEDVISFSLSKILYTEGEGGGWVNNLLSVVCWPAGIIVTNL